MKINNKKIKSLYNSVVKKISPINISGGLAIGDSYIRYARFNESGKVVEKESLRLPPGAVSGGKIIQNDIVVGALTSLRSMIDINPHRKAEVIFSLSSDSVYSQLFNLPDLGEESLAEAAELNIQMISPIDVKKSYYSYQVVGRSESPTSGGYELIGAFISASIIDEWIVACKTAGFLPIAIEFQALSATRAVSEIADIKNNGITLLLDVESEGMDMIIIKNENLYFDYFYSWKLIQGEDKSISFEKFKQILITETGKVINFALSKFGGETKSILVNAEGIGKEMVATLKTQYPALSVSEINSAEKRIPPLWLSAFGAAKRGTLLRSEDNFISLTSQQVMEEYVEQQLIVMIKFWRKISAIVLGFFLFAFCLSNLFLRQVKFNLDRRTIRNLSPGEAQELSLLQKQANEFNRLVSYVSEAKVQEDGIYPFVSKIINAGNDIQITRLSFQGLSTPVILNGSSPSSVELGQFQKRLAEMPNINSIQVPLQSIVSAPNGRTSFVMSFVITNLNFK